MPDDDKKYYRNPEYTNEGLKKEISDRKRPTGPVERKSSAEYDLDPVKGESGMDLELQKRLDEGNQSGDDPARKRTLHDPKKFEELMKERASQFDSQQVQKITNPEIEALRQSGLRGIS